MLAVQVGTGIAQGAKAGKARRQTERLGAAIPQEDPGVREMLNDIMLRRDYSEAGMTRMFGVQRRLAERGGAQIMANIRRSSGTAPGTTQQGLLRTQDIMQGGLHAAGAGADQQSMQYTAMAGPLVSDMADRKLSLQTYLRDFSAFQAAQHQQNSSAALTSATGLAAGLDLSSLGGGGAGKVGAPAGGGGRVGNPTGIDFTAPLRGPFDLEDPNYG